MGEVLLFPFVQMKKPGLRGSEQLAWLGKVGGSLVRFFLREYYILDCIVCLSLVASHMLFHLFLNGTVLKLNSLLVTE